MKLIELSVNNLALTFPIGHAFSAEAGRRPFKDEGFSKMWESLLECGMGKIYALVEYETDPQEFRAVAVLGATFLPDPFSGVLTAAEHFWYVLPEHRKSGIGLQLLDKFEADAKAKGCQQVVMVHFMHMSAGLAKLYEARGYSALEQTYKKEI
jgi:GNAT superfamily N-acetyltransferase